MPVGTSESVVSAWSSRTNGGYQTSVGQLTDQPADYPPELVAPQTRRVWHAVADEAFARGDDYIGTEHFLFALFCDHDNAAAQVLTRLGAGEREVRTVVAELLAESGRERSA